ncbi:MAG: hypothetical protein E5W78_13865 [Mesorhizobium sp.]|nr:MAG: hypothetical protein E5W78_13865 [Mesorhizobium sp.]
MNRFKTYLAAASAMACLAAPASAGGPEGMNGKSLNGLQLNAVTSNAVTSNGLGVLALNGVHADGIVLAKSLAPAGGSVVHSNNGNLPAVQHGNVQSSTIGKKSNGLPSAQHSTGSDAGTNPDRPTPSPRR